MSNISRSKAKEHVKLGRTMSKSKTISLMRVKVRVFDEVFVKTFSWFGIGGIGGCERSFLKNHFSPCFIICLIICVFLIVVENISIKTVTGEGDHDHSQYPEDYDNEMNYPDDSKDGNENEKDEQEQEFDDESPRIVERLRHTKSSPVNGSTGSLTGSGGLPVQSILRKSGPSQTKFVTLQVGTSTFKVRDLFAFPLGVKDKKLQLYGLFLSGG